MVWLSAFLVVAPALCALPQPVGGAGSDSPEKAGGRPNIILITADTFRPDHLGYHGREGDPSPVLDSLAAEGAFFRQAYSSSGWTSPGLLSILTGLDALGHGVDIRGRSLPTDVRTLPEVLRQAGYRAPDIFFLTDMPNFDNLGFAPYSRRGQLLHDGDEILFHWLREEAGSGKPFFLYYHYRDLHLPYDPGEPYESMYVPPVFSSRLPLVEDVRRFLTAEKMNVVKSHIHLIRGVIDFDRGDRAWVRALYDAQVRRMDTELFGRLRRVLREEDLAQNTMVIVSADHGEELLEHDLIGHVSTYKEGRLYEEVIRIPLLFWFPGVIPPGQAIDPPVHCTGIMPTVLELAGVSEPEGMQGQSLVPLLTGTGEWTERPLFFATSGAGYTADPEQYARRYRAVRAGSWKLHHQVSEQHVELYDLAADPEEDRNLARRHPAVADNLQGLLEDWVVQRQLQNAVARSVPPDVAPDTGTADTAALATSGAESREGAGMVRDSGPGGPGARVEILFPQDGDTLQYMGAQKRIELRWSGPPQERYVVDYQVGEGDYRLAGEFVVEGSTPRYGPFTPTVWNSVVLYNPFRFRVYPEGRPEAASVWTSFRIERTTGAEDSGFSLVSLGLTARRLSTGLVRHTTNLVTGLGRGLLDVYILAARVPAADWSAYALLLVIGGVIVWPHLARLGVERCRAWGAVLLYVAVVYSTIPVMPVMWRTLERYTEGSVRYLGIVVVVGFAAFVLVRVWLRNGLHRVQPYLALALIMPAYAYLLHRYASFPAERLHLVEYGFMGWVLFRALRLDMSSRAAYVLSLAGTVLIGMGDECFQWILPQRVFELKDIRLNAVSGGLGLLVLRFAEEPDRMPDRDRQQLKPEGDEP